MKNSALIFTFTLFLCSVTVFADSGTNVFFYIKTEGKQLTVKAAETKAASELMEMLGEKDLTIKMTGNNFEQYGSLGKNLSAEDVSITATAGDVLLYNSNIICIFYASNKYRYTRLGKIEDATKAELKELLSGKDLTIVLSKQSSGDIPEPTIPSVSLLILLAVKKFFGMK